MNKEKIDILNREPFVGVLYEIIDTYIGIYKELF